jgi:UDP-N-acetylmuramate dehydrogenase
VSRAATRRDPAIEAVAARLGPLARRDVALGPLCTYRVGGPAALFVAAGSLATLDTVGRAVADSGVAVLVVGRGSNLLVADAGFAGLALQLTDELAGVGVDGTSVHAGGAALLPVVARHTARAGLTGFEWAVGVPGSIGGAVRMNAGGHGSDMAASLAAAEVFDLGTGRLETWTPERLRLGYRRSALGPGQVVVGAGLSLRPGDAEASRAAMADIVRWRRAHQPGGQNAGSVFANPEGDSAGRLIEEAGLKGHRIGTAEVSTRHANFIQADPAGSADDVAALMAHVQRVVHERTGVLLRPENHLVGFPPGAGPLRAVRR